MATPHQSRICSTASPQGEALISSARFLPPVEPGVVFLRLKALKQTASELTDAVTLYLQQINVCCCDLCGR